MPQYWLEPAPLIEQVVAAARAGAGPIAIATHFHAALLTGIMEIASRFDVDCVAFSGGCFQNRRLLQGCVTALKKQGKPAIIHRSLPPNDGGISLGQALVARASFETLVQAR